MLKRVNQKFLKRKQKTYYTPLLSDILSNIVSKRLNFYVVPAFIIWERNSILRNQMFWNKNSYNYKIIIKM